MTETKDYCDCCKLLKNSKDGEWCETLFVCNDCLYDPDYGFGSNIKIKNNTQP